jgi:hypothetical protein
VVEAVAGGYLNFLDDETEKGRDCTVTANGVRAFLIPTDD